MLHFGGVNKLFSNINGVITHPGYFPETLALGGTQASWNPMTSSGIVVTAWRIIPGLVSSSDHHLPFISHGIMAICKGSQKNRSLKNNNGSNDHHGPFATNPRRKSKSWTRWKNPSSKHLQPNTTNQSTTPPCVVSYLGLAESSSRLEKTPQPRRSYIPPRRNSPR